MSTSQTHSMLPNKHNFKQSEEAFYKSELQKLQLKIDKIDMSLIYLNGLINCIIRLFKTEKKLMRQIY